MSEVTEWARGAVTAMAANSCLWVAAVTVSGNQIVFATSCASHQPSVQRVVVEAEGVDTKIANLLMTLTGWV